ncbi:MAG: LamG domain-containing protein [Clostridia bacterium]|nr:LamG domain-containing protein [Clostridia bacterium]
MKRVCSGICAAVLTVALWMMAAPSVLAAEGYDEYGCLSIVTEPGQTSEYVACYKGDETVPSEQMTWVDGVHGKALSLDGASNYLELGFGQMRIAQMTFATWINFRGALTPSNPASAYGQRLFTIHEGEMRYFTVSPHAFDANLRAADGGQLDGVYLEFYRGDDEEGGSEFTLQSFVGARPGQSQLGVPQNEWHHMAVVADGQTAKVYIDGTLILDDVLMEPIVQMYADGMMIGKGLWNDPLLNAALDDTYIYEKALSRDQILSLMQTGDPALRTAPTEESRYYPTAAPTTIAPLETTRPVDKPDVPFGLPEWGFRLVVILLAIIVVITVAVNLYESGWRRRYGKKAENETADEEPPAMSIKEAAKRKRQADKEQFEQEERRESGEE